MSHGSGSAAAAAPTSAADEDTGATGLRIGDPVLVYSVSQKKWFPGEIATILDESPDSPTASVVNSSPQYVSVRYWIGHTHRAKRVAGNSKDLRRVTNGINRFDWDIGTILECWSNTKQSWFTAKVTDIRRVNGGYDSDGIVDSNRIWLELQWEVLTESTGDTKRLSKEFALSSYWIRYSHKHSSMQSSGDVMSSSRGSGSGNAANTAVTEGDNNQRNCEGSSIGEGGSSADNEAAENLPVNRVSRGKRDRSGSNGSNNGSGRSRRRSGSGNGSEMGKRKSKLRSGRKTVVESWMTKLLDPHSQLVYLLANGAVLLIMLSMTVLYVISPSIHFLVMGLLSLGLFLSINFVWRQRNLVMSDSSSGDGSSTAAAAAGSSSSSASGGTSGSSKKSRRTKQD